MDEEDELNRFCVFIIGLLFRKIDILALPPFWHRTETNKLLNLTDVTVET
jgi:hypothetical protein